MPMMMMGDKNGMKLKAKQTHTHKKHKLFPCFFVKQSRKLITHCHPLNCSSPFPFPPLWSMSVCSLKGKLLSDLFDITISFAYLFVFRLLSQHNLCYFSNSLEVTSLSSVPSLFYVNNGASVESQRFQQYLNQISITENKNDFIKDRSIAKFIHFREYILLQ